MQQETVAKQQETDPAEQGDNVDGTIDEEGDAGQLGDEGEEASEEDRGQDQGIAIFPDFRIFLYYKSPFASNCIWLR